MSLWAVPRQFNRDILSAALGADATSTFQWLSTQSFVRRNTENGWFYHERVRELMLRHLRQTTPKDLDDTHTRLVAFFTAGQTGLNLEGKAAYDSESWKNYESERIYHIVNAQPDRHQHESVNAFFHAFRWRWGFADRIARSFQQCGRERDSQSARKLATTLAEIYRAYDQDDFQSGIESLRSLESLKNLTVTSRCEIYEMIGEFCSKSGKQDLALLNYYRAIELDEKYTLAITNRGVTYQSMERYEEALADFTRAIELDEKDTWAITNRGVTYQSMERYEEALADFTRAIELDAEEANAHLSLIACYRKLGRMEEYQRQVESVRSIFEKESVYNRACFAAACGHTENALALLRTALENKEMSVKLASTAWLKWLYISPGLIKSGRIASNLTTSVAIYART